MDKLFKLPQFNCRESTEEKIHRLKYYHFLQANLYHQANKLRNNYVIFRHILVTNKRN